MASNVEEVSVPVVLENLAASTGSSAAALRLFFSLLFGFPLAVLYKRTLYGSNPHSQHLYFIICGITIGLWNFGWDILHSVTAIALTHGIFKTFGPTNNSVFFVFIYNMAHLLYGYMVTSTDSYDIKWTMPHCVLTLRLIALAFDLADGSQPEENLSANQKKTVLREQPSLLEMAAFIYFPGSFLIGPQYNIRRYLDYVNGKLIEPDTSNNASINPPSTIIPAITRLMLGFLYMAMYLIGTNIISDEYLQDPAFGDLWFIKRFFYLGLWGRCNLYKYISCWLIAESVCILFGISYNGKDKNGRKMWDGLANVYLMTFENATEMNHYILSFNVNTNHWCAEYIYKRLKFLGSKVYSQFGTLLFLAIWHGVHSGYYMCFFMEFIIMYCEKDLKPVLAKHTKINEFVNRSLLSRLITWSLLKTYTFMVMGYSVLPLVLLTYSRYMPVYANVYYFGHVIFLSYPLLAPFIKKTLRQGNKSQRPE